MKQLLIILFSIAIGSSVQGQSYLISKPSWQLKIKKNYFLAPLFYGIKKNNVQLDKEKKLVSNFIAEYGTSNAAYKQLLINGWNFFTIGVTDSAIISFNEAYLLDSSNLETLFAFGSVITFLDGKPNFELITHYKLNDKVSSTWDLTAFFGDSFFLDELKKIKKKQVSRPILAALLLNPFKPYYVDSAKYIVLKIEYDNHEGFYKMGRPSGIWTDYFFGTKKIMRTYNIVNGRETGEITAYHKNGNLSAKFYKNSSGDIDGEFKVYDYNGQLVRIEYWHENQSNAKDTKVVREWEEDGETTTEVVNGELKTFIWKDGRKTLQQ